MRSGRWWGFQITWGLEGPGQDVKFYPKEDKQHLEGFRGEQCYGLINISEGFLWLYVENRLWQRDEGQERQQGAWLGPLQGSGQEMLVV